MTPVPPPDTALAALRAEAAHLRRVNQELLATVAEPRAIIEKQQAHTARLVRLPFGPRADRLTGPTLFDDIANPDPPPATGSPSAPDPTPHPATPRRWGHGRRPRPVDLPRERVEIDLTDAEKACPCCHRTRIRIGA